MQTKEPVPQAISQEDEITLSFMIINKYQNGYHVTIITSHGEGKLNKFVSIICILHCKQDQITTLIKSKILKGTRTYNKTIHQSCASDQTSLKKLKNLKVPKLVTQVY
uniref:Uncharacterized protein n=1 Tax=Rhizophora mucronata TaxID=61149 RepID=A0A2P2QE00_RHIMU